MSTQKLNNVDIDIQQLNTKSSWNPDMYYPTDLTLEDVYFRVNAYDGLLELVKNLDKRLSTLEGVLNPKGEA